MKLTRLAVNYVNRGKNKNLNRRTILYDEGDYHDGFQGLISTV